MWDNAWENLFLFSLNLLGEAECLVCNKVIKKKYSYDLKRHYKLHQELHSISGEERAQLLSKLKEEFRLKNLRLQNKYAVSSVDPTDKQVKATYVLSLALAKKGRPFEEAEFFKELWLLIMPLFGEAGQQMADIIKVMPLSSQTITRRTEDIGQFLQWEAQERIKNATYVSVCFDECVDITATSQIIICIKTVDNSFNAFEEIFKLESCCGKCTGKAIYEALNKNIFSLIETQKLSAICTNGAPVMAGQNHEGFEAHLTNAGIHVPIFQSTLDQQAVFSRTICLKEAMKIAFQIISRLRVDPNALTHRKLKGFLKEIDADCGDVLSFMEVRWLSRGKCLEILFNLRAEIENFLISQDCANDADILNSLKCPNFLFDLGFLVDITQHINKLNLVFQEKDKNITDLLYAINEFLRKLIVLRDQIACQNLSNFPKTQEVFTRFPYIEKLQVLTEEINLLLEIFQSRLKYFLDLQWIVNVFNNPLTCSFEDVPSNVKTELIFMRQDLLIPLEMGINFWKNICPQKYPIIRDLILKLFSMFTTTYICELAFSSMSQIKNKFRSKLTDSHLETLLKIKCYEQELDIDKLIEFKKTNK